MALTAQQAAAMVHEQLDDMAAGLDTQDDGNGRYIGDYTFLLEYSLRDVGFSDITEATSGAEERAILHGMEYYGYRRLFRKYAARVSQQQGAGASGMHLSMDWSSTAKTLRMHLAQARAAYEGALRAIGISLEEDPESPSTASQFVVVDPDTEVGQALIRPYDGLPWFAEAVY